MRITPLHDAQLLALTLHRRLLALALVASLAAFLFSLFVTFFQAEILDEPRATTPASRRIADRVLLVVIDGLRADTAFDSGCMPRLAGLAGDHVHGIAWATPITMTGVGIKALGGGVSSGLWSIARNWDPPRAIFDNLFDALRRRGDHIALVGNPTWAALYGPATEIDPQRRRMTDLFHLIDPVYGDDLVWARYARRVVEADGWDLAIVHLGGIDNASHIWTPRSPLFCEKARTMDRDVAAIIESAGPRTTVLVTSDHGTGDRGHHGSGEPEARRTPLLLLGPGFHDTGSVEAQQLDLAPTIAVLLGLPIPAPVEGRPLTEVLALDAGEAHHVDEVSVRQAQDYVDRYAARWHLPAPRFTAPGQLGPWLAHVRSGSGIAPLVLSAILASCALLLFLAGAPSGQAPADRRALTAIVIALVALELVVGWWRLHSRAVEIAVHRLLGAAGHAAGLVAWTIAVVLGLLATPLLARLRLRSRLTMTLLLFCASVLGDSLVVPTAVVLFVAVVGVVGGRRVQLVSAAILLGGETLTWATRDMPLARVGLIASLSSFGERWIHPFLAATVAIVLFHGAIGTTRARRLALGALGLIALALLTEPAQAIGFLAVTICVVAAGRALDRGDDARRVELSVLALVAARVMFVHVFEGELSFSRLEINLGYLANPGQNHAVGAATILAKLFLPMFVAWALLTAGCTAERRAGVLFGAMAFFALRIFHIALSMVIARETFYSPYADAGQLLFHVVFLLSLLLLLLTEPRTLRREQVVSA